MPRESDRGARDAGGRRRVLSTGRVVFLVIAAAAPMAAMVGNVPLAMIRGTGAGLSAAFVLGLLVLLCFSAGYATMSRRVVNTGAFYTYIARALASRPAWPRPMSPCFLTRRWPPGTALARSRRRPSPGTRFSPGPWASR